MTAFTERRMQDLEKLRALASRSSGKIQVVSVRGNPPNEIELELRYRTAGSKDYPRSAQSTTRVVVQLSSRYPFQEPNALVRTPIVHPNVYASGKICLGAKWLPTQGLDLLVQRIVRIVTFDPTILNARSPANGDASNWYQVARRAHPEAFPTDVVSFAAESRTGGVKWQDRTERDSQAAESRRVVTCPRCGVGLRLPVGRIGIVRCPKCAVSFEAQT